MPDRQRSSRRDIAILFVCLGNICRSPMAEAIMRHLVQHAGLEQCISIDSAGTGAWHVGDPPHVGTLRVLQAHGMRSSHRARVITQHDFSRFDYVVAMDQENIRNVRVMGAAATTQLALLLEYVPELGVNEVPDPYYTGQFEATYALIERGCQGLLEHILTQHHLARP